MLTDSHCHAWRMWPYDKSVPDPQSRGSIETLLYEMDAHNISRASVVCARIGGGAGGDGFENADNNDYVGSFAQKHADRISAWVDVDCMWRSEHHKTGSVDRLKMELERNSAKGFTHYVGPKNDGWLVSEEGREFFSTAAELKVIASLSISSPWFADLREIANENPTMPFLIHHMSLPRRDGSNYNTSDISELLKCASAPNIGVKISGFNYNSAEDWNFPYLDSIELFKTIYEAFGASRLYWGSDFPASRDKITYTQSLEVVRSHCDFVPDGELALILGDNLDRILNKPHL